MKTDVILEGLAFPEGPAFASDGSLWCVELKGGSLVHWRDGKAERYPVGGAPNGIVIDASDRVWFCDAKERSIRRMDTPGSPCTTICSHLDSVPLDKPNDLAFDSRGNLIFTCPGESRKEPTGYVCCLRPDGSLLKIAEGMYFPNGLGFAEGDRILIIVETYQQRLWRGEWDPETAEWTKARPWANIPGGVNGPDGVALGTDGLLYVASYGTGCVKVVNPEGEIIRALELPGRNPTNVAFDPNLSLGLVVTEAEKGMLLSLPEVGPGVQLYKGQGVPG